MEPSLGCRWEPILRIYPLKKIKGFCSNYLQVSFLAGACVFLRNMLIRVFMVMGIDRVICSL